ncbi:MAG: ATP-dependent helicase [Pseudomonadota bacterium]|nr:ATP-dependent helicase [Pseudomonadota bacterium]
MPPEIDLFAVNRGSVTAPAGCGKTQLIVDTLGQHIGLKPILILTHTNAGVAALRARLHRTGIPSSAHRIATIDGFAMRLIGKFPMRSGHNPRILEINDSVNDYPAIRDAAWHLLQAGHVNDALRATYSRMLVDEYQDCNIAQHSIVAWAAQVLPTCVLGDPMQAIFGFAGNRLVDWAADVQTQFPAIGTLQIPWRWHLAGAENLGNWLLAARAQLEAGQPIDLRTAPPQVQWVQLSAATAVPQRLAAARTRAPDGRSTVLIIGDARNALGRHQLTSQTPGATAVEAVDLIDLVRFARGFDPVGVDSLTQLIAFAASLMTGVGAAGLVARVETIRKGRARNPPTPIEEAAVAYANAPSLVGSAQLLQGFSVQPGTHIFRPDVLSCCLTAMRAAANGSCTLHTAALQARERNRHLGRPPSRRAVGSTLLLKGLEADIAVILHPERMTAQNLYVALTRGARQVVICSESHLLRPVA